MFCVKCKKPTNTDDIQYVVTKNGRNMKRGKCIDCGIIKTQFVKGKIGSSIDKKKKLTWTDELAEELHKPVTKKFPKRTVYVKGIDEIWAGDLVDMKSFSKSNGGIKYLLTVIDIFSKFGWIIPLKDKTGKSVSEGFERIFKERKPKKIWVDKGREFYNKDVKSLIELYSTENEEKSCVVERWIRTMKEKMFKYFTANSTQKYIDILDKLVEQYNNTKHSSIKMTPVEASKHKNEDTVWKNLYGDFKVKYKKPKYSVGDKVRISKKKKTFEKGYTPRWTEEVFIISEIKHTIPITYKITDWNHRKIEGTFYEQELQKTNQKKFRIEKIINKGKTMSLVKWKGYPSSFNSWVDNSSLLNL